MEMKSIIMNVDSILLKGIAFGKYLEPV